MISSHVRVDRVIFAHVHMVLKLLEIVYLCLFVNEGPYMFKLAPTLGSWWECLVSLTIICGAEAPEANLGCSSSVKDVASLRVQPLCVSLEDMGELPCLGERSGIVRVVRLRSGSI